MGALNNSFVVLLMHCSLRRPIERKTTIERKQKWQVENTPFFLFKLQAHAYLQLTYPQQFQVQNKNKNKNKNKKSVLLILEGEWNNK